MSRPTHVQFDSVALAHNLAMVRKYAPESRVLAMVKSNAYGHGLARAIGALRDADAFGVACSEEAVQLRVLGVTRPIVLMEGLFDATELPLVAKNHFSLVVHHAAQIDMLAQAKLVRPINVWLKINTGMQRLGFAPADVAAAHSRLLQCAAVAKPIGLMSHFAEADNVASDVTARQLALFNDVTANLPGPRSLANSGAILGWPATHMDWVRPGLMLYGVSPFVDKTSESYDLQPVMSFASALIAVYPVTQGARIGYGGTYTCATDMRVGVVAVGYGDGYPRHAVSGTPVWVNGKPCQLVGRVSMDMLTVDLTTQPAAKIGDPVLLWGAGLSVETVASYCGTTAYELLTRIAPRVRIVQK